MKIENLGKHLNQQPKITQLPNGAIIASLEFPEHSSTALAVWVLTGSRYEPEELNGISHFLEHMVFKGSRKRTSWQISATVEGGGGDINAQTSEEYTTFYAVTPNKHWKLVADVLLEMVLNPRLERTDVEVERGVILDEIRMCNDDTEQRAYDLLTEIFWETPSLCRPIAGTIRSVSSITSDDLRKYHEAGYTPNNLIITGAGGLVHEQLVKIADKYLQKATCPQKFEYPTKSQTPKIPICCEEKPTEQVQVAAGFPTPGYRSEERYALSLLQVILGGNFCSRMNQELREKRGWCYHAGASLHQLSSEGMLNLSLGIEPQNLLPCLKTLKKIIERLIERGCTKSEVRRACEFLIGSAEISLERTATLNSRLAHSLIGFGRYIPHEEWVSKLRQVTAEQVHAMAKKYLDFRVFKIAIVGSEVPEKQIHKLFFGNGVVAN